jgi:hypothetical protein
MNAESSPAAVAQAFVTALGARDYATAYALTSETYRQANGLDAMRDAFELVVPSDWGPVGPIAVAETLIDWPGKHEGDVAWMFVSVGGDMYSEAVTAVITREGSDLKVRSAEFGRP